MNTANKKRIQKTKNANVRDRLRLVGDVQGGMSITGAAKKLGMSQSWGSKWWRSMGSHAYLIISTILSLVHPLVSSMLFHAGKIVWTRFQFMVVLFISSSL